MSIFSVRLQEIREKRGFSRKEIADILEITPRAYQYYEEGKRDPSYDKLVILAQQLNTSSDYLLGLSDTPR